MGECPYLIVSQRFLLMVLRETSPSVYALINPLVEQGYTVNGRSLRNV